MNNGKQQVKTTDKMTATERLEALESNAVQLNNQNSAIINELQSLRGSITAVLKRLDATIEVGSTGNINAEAVNDKVLKSRIKELEVAIVTLTNAGYLKSAETVNKSSFVVFRELDKDKNVLNPRLQYPVAELIDGERFNGKKVGDVVETGTEGAGLTFELLEIYDITNPEQAKTEPKAEVTQ
jgi:hypothetical protein